MQKIVDDYIYISFTNFNVLNNKKYENDKKDNFDYILIEKIDKEKIKLDEKLLNLNIVKKDEICIPIEKGIFIENIERGYPDNKIWKQFLQDIDRCECYFNNNLIKLENANIFKDYLEEKFTQYKVNLILMLCTQSVLAYPFEIIQNSLVNRYLSEISFKDREDYLRILMFNNNDEINFCIKKRMRIFRINKNSDDITTEYINIKLDFNIDSDEYILMKISLEKNKK